MVSDQIKKISALATRTLDRVKIISDLALTGSLPVFPTSGRSFDGLDMVLCEAYRRAAPRKQSRSDRVYVEVDTGPVVSRV